MIAREPTPIEALDLFMPDRRALLELLASLEPGEWELPTACSGWDVRDVCLHLLGVDLGNIAIRRDGWAYLKPASGEDLGRFINRINTEWVTAARRLTPRLIVELLEFTAEPMVEGMRRTGGDAVHAQVSWAGDQLVPRWLDIAREYMERWVHQQHIREAVGRPGQDSTRFAGPVIAASMFAVPPAMRGQAGGPVVITVEGAGGGDWSVVHADQGWKLLQGAVAAPASRLRIGAGDWWRTLTLGLSPEQALSRASVDGDREDAFAALTAVAIIA